MRFIILPGNGCTNIFHSNWYGWLAHELANRKVEVAIENMPDPYIAKESVWIPFIHNTLKVDEDTCVIGHSSGALAAMRLIEKTPVYGAILVSAAHTDLGDENERASGYFDRPWDFASMRQNTKGFLHQFHSDDDPLIPISEAKYVSEHLKAEDSPGLATFTYQELHGHSHFFEPFEELLQVIDVQLEAQQKALQTKREEL